MPATRPKQLQNLWDDWFAERNEETANELMTHYMYIVDYHVERIASHIPPSFDRNDLKSLGLMGLYDALLKFDASRKLKFSTYATIRVRGAIIDGLRREDWLPRSLREQTKQIERAIKDLEQELQRTPQVAEIAAKLNIDEHKVEETMAHALFANIISLDSTVNHGEEDQEIEITDLIEDDHVLHPESKLVHNELTDELMNEIQKLNDNEQLVLSLFYEEELTLTEIGVVLNLSTSRISQIHKQAIVKLRQTLQKLM